MGQFITYCFVISIVVGVQDATWVMEQQGCTEFYPNWLDTLRAQAPLCQVDSSGSLKSCNLADKVEGTGDNLMLYLSTQQDQTHMAVDVAEDFKIISIVGGSQNGQSFSEYMSGKNEGVRLNLVLQDINFKAIGQLVSFLKDANLIVKNLHLFSAIFSSDNSTLTPALELVTEDLNSLKIINSMMYDDLQLDTIDFAQLSHLSICNAFEFSINLTREFIPSSKTSMPDLQVGLFLNNTNLLNDRASFYLDQNYGSVTPVLDWNYQQMFPQIYVAAPQSQGGEEKPPSMALMLQGGKFLTKEVTGYTGYNIRELRLNLQTIQRIEYGAIAQGENFLIENVTHYSFDGTNVEPNRPFFENKVLKQMFLAGNCSAMTGIKLSDKRDGVFACMLCYLHQYNMHMNKDKVTRRCTQTQQTEKFRRSVVHPGAPKKRGSKMPQTTVNMSKCFWRDWQPQPTPLKDPSQPILQHPNPSLGMTGTYCLPPDVPKEYDPFKASYKHLADYQNSYGGGQMGNDYYGGDYDYDKTSPVAAPPPPPATTPNFREAGIGLGVGIEASISFLLACLALQQAYRQLMFY